MNNEQIVITRCYEQRHCQAQPQPQLQLQADTQKIIFVREPGFGFRNVRTIYLDKFSK